MENPPTVEQNFARRTHKIDICHAFRLVAAGGNGVLFIAAVSGKTTLRLKIRAASRTLTAHPKSPVTSNGVSTAFLLERFVARRTVIPQHLEFRFSPEYRSDVANHCRVEVGIAM